MRLSTNPRLWGRTDTIWKHVCITLFWQFLHISWENSSLVHRHNDVLIEDCYKNKSNIVLMSLVFPLMSLLVSYSHLVRTKFVKLTRKITLLPGTLDPCTDRLHWTWYCKLFTSNVTVFYGNIDYTQKLTRDWL